MHNRDLDALESAVGLLLLLVLGGLALGIVVAILLVVVAVSLR